MMNLFKPQHVQSQTKIDPRVFGIGSDDPIDPDQAINPVIDDSHFDDLLEGLPIEESIISKQLYEIQQIVETLAADHQSVPKQAEIPPNHNRQEMQLTEYLDIVAKCQEQTAAIANSNLERHTLYPIIKLAFFLMNTLDQVAGQIQSLKSEQGCPYSSQIFSSILEASNQANAKCEVLDIVAIKPEHLDELDSQRHRIVNTVVTSTKQHHRAIQSTLVPGLAYQDKVLEPAKVCVYRYVDSQSSIKECNHENEE